MINAFAKRMINALRGQGDGDDKQSITPTETIASAIETIKATIAENERHRTKVEQQKQEIGKKIHKLLQEEATCMKNAKSKSRNGISQEEWLEKLRVVRENKAGYEEMYAAISSSLVKMEERLNILNRKLESVSRQKDVLSSELSVEKSFQQLNQHLDEIGFDEVIEEYETEVIKVSLENDLAQGIMEIDQVLAETSQKETVQALHREVEEAAAQESAKKTEAIKRKYDQFWDDKTENKSLVQKKESMFKSFKSVKETKTEQLSEKWGDFFSDVAVNGQQKETIQDFFKEEKSGAPPQDKKGMMDDFFGQ